MNIFRILLRYEWLHFKASRGLVLLTGLLLAVGFYGIYYGTTEVARQRAHLAELPRLAARNVAELKTKFPGPADAGEIGYYHTTFAVHHPTAWAGLALGQRDVNPYYLKLRLLGLQGQLYASENVNPTKVLTGNFDLAFVLVYLVPLLIIALGFNILSSEREQGILPLLLAQPVRAGQLVAAKLTFQLGLVLGLVGLLSVVGAAWARVPLDGRLALWLGLTGLYCVFWLGVVLLVAAGQRSSSFNAVALLGVWLGLLVLVPSLLQVYVAAARPVAQGLALTVQQREAIHGGWDRPKAETMTRFYGDYPQYRDTAAIRERFAWRWYYAFQYLGDKSAAPLAAAYATGLRQRAELAGRLAWLSPAVALQASLSALAGTDLPAHLAFQQSATRYHSALRAFYYPFLFRQIPFTHADYAREPRHTFTSPPDLGTARRSLWQLLAALGVVGALGLGLFQARPISVGVSG
jgi:ABC-2 type transport system permease protein